MSEARALSPVHATAGEEPVDVDGPNVGVVVGHRETPLPPLDVNRALDHANAFGHMSERKYRWRAR
jgi:hypothetical protein